jgi:hypothetical protein
MLMNPREEEGVGTITGLLGGKPVGILMSSP